MNEISTVSSSKTDLMQQSELYKPMLYYGSKPTIKFDYVSDIHLLHHVRYFDNNINKTLRLTAKSLYESTHPLTMPLFLGDISSDRTLTVSFYKQFRINVLFPQYKRFKRMLLNAEDISELERRRDEALHHRDILAKYNETEQENAEYAKFSDDGYGSPCIGFFELIAEYINNSQQEAA